MFGSGGWTKDPLELLEWQLLPWIAGQPPNEPGTAQFLDGRDWTEDDLGAMVRSLNDAGLTRRPDSLAMGRLDTRITPDGHAEVRRLLAARQDRAKRAVAAQEALLDWLYDDDQDPAGSSFPSPTAFRGDLRAHFYGEPFEVPEIERAASALHEARVVHGVTSWGSRAPHRVRMEPAGREIVERGGVLYPPRGVVQTFNNAFHAPVGQVAQGSGFQQVQTVYGIQPGQLAEALSAVSRAADDDLSPEDAEVVRRALVTIEDEAAEGFPTPAVVHRRLRALRAVSERCVSAINFGGALATLYLMLEPVIGAAL